MANQLTINIGTVPNDGTGDPLRTAFNEVNLNFSNVWATGLPNSNVQFNNNRITTVLTNANLILAPNGTGKVASNVDIVPNTHQAFNLGSPTRRWNTLYTQFINGTNLTISGDLSVGGNLTVTGNIIEMGNIVTDALTLQLANTAANAAAANGAGITVGASDNIATLLYDSGNNVWDTNIGLQVDGAITGTSIAVSDATVYGNLAAINGNFTGNVTANYFFGNGSQLTGITSYANSNAVAYGESGWAGNIIPTGNAVYSLGNATNQWKSLYVSNTTIYINNVPIGLSEGNVLTVNGEAVLSNDSDTNITTTGNLTANIITATESADLGSLNFYAATMSMADDLWNNISISPNVEGWAFLQIPKDSVANVDNVRLYNSAGNVELGSGDFSNDGPSYSWLFDKTGNLTIPNGGYINFVNTGGLTQALNEDLKFTVSDDEEDGWAVTSIVNDGAGTELTRMQVRYDGIRINTDVSGLNYSWDFRDSGEFDVPKSIRGPVGGNLIISIGDQPASDTFIDLQTRSYVGDALISNIRIANPNVTVSTTSGAYNWTFDGTGNLVLPPSGNMVGATVNNAGHLQWVGNSSGDGGGYTTLRLVPDDTRESADQYLIIDPTAPGHIHIRAGGTQDNSNADLFLGGENSHFKVNAGANNEVRISANSHAWTFGADSVLTVPGEGVLRSIGDSVTLQSYNVGTGNVQSVYLGSGGGLGFFDQDIGGNWLEIFKSGAEPQIRVPVGRGNLNVQTAEGVNAYDWVFDNTGVLTVPGNITGANVVSANTFVSNAFNVVTAGNLSITSQYGLGFTGTILEDNGTLELIGSGAGGVYAGWDSTYGNGLGNIATVSFNEVGGEGILLRTGNRAATEYNWNFDNTGNLTLPGNITGNTAGYTIGYRDIPQVTFSANATAALTDAGKHFYSTTAGNLSITLPDNSSVAFPTGATLTIVVNAAGNVLVGQGTGVTLYQAGASATGNRVVGAYGLASVMKVAANTWVISGTGVY